MAYEYQAERAELFTEQGQIRFIKIRDKVLAAMRLTGAFRLQELGIANWQDIACIDRMVELGELIELKRECWGQYRVFTTSQVHNL